MLASAGGVREAAPDGSDGAIKRRGRAEVSAWHLAAAMVPLFVGSHLAAFFHGKAAGIRWSQEMRAAQTGSKDT